MTCKLNAGNPHQQLCPEETTEWPTGGFFTTQKLLKQENQTIPAVLPKQRDVKRQIADDKRDDINAPHETKKYAA